MLSNRIIVGFCLTVGVCLPVLSATPVNNESKQTPEVPWDVLDSGGGLMCSPSYSIGGSLGQIAPGVCTTTTRIVSGGYWAGIDSLPPCEPGCECGDCNGDGEISIADAIYLVGYIYRSGDAPACECDVNLVDGITIADAIYLVSYIYRGGPEPCNPPVVHPPVRQENRMER